jgi:prefoldin subunit 5
VSDLLWAAVAFCLLVFTLGGVMLVAAALIGLRLFKAVRGTLFEAVTGVAKQVEELERRLEDLSAHADDAKRALDDLSQTMRRAQVPLSATRDVRQAVTRVTGLVPKK